MSEFEGMPDCALCGHPAESHDDEFGDCQHLPEAASDGCDCPGYVECVPMNSFSIVVTAVQLLRYMGMLNDCVYHARPHQLRAITLAVARMNADGCSFDAEEIARLAGEGEESEALADYGQFIGFSELERLLDEIFEQPDDFGASDEDGLCRAQVQP